MLTPFDQLFYLEDYSELFLYHQIYPYPFLLKYKATIPQESKTT